jgi:hypothetical protein
LVLGRETLPLNWFWEDARLQPSHEGHQNLSGLEQSAEKLVFGWRSSLTTCGNVLYAGKVPQGLRAGLILWSLAARLETAPF